MPEKKKETKAKKVAETKEKKIVSEVVDMESEKYEKELLREAEEREKERKELEEIEKKEAKAEAKEAEKEQKEIKKAEKHNIRRKPRHGKKYRAVVEKIEAGKEYELDEAIELLRETAVSKFEATIEMHIKLNKKLENVRGTMTLPGGAVKEKKVLEVTEKNIDEVVAKVKSGKIDFDVMVAHPKVMPKLAALAKTLGPKGLMPNPKSGTVSEDVSEAAQEFRGGRVEYKADKSNIVHLAIAKAKTDNEKIKQNIEVILSQFPTMRIDSAYLATTMGPSVRIKIK